RKKVVLALLSHQEWAPALLKAIEDHQVEPGVIDAGARDRLLQNPDAGIRQRAQRLFQSSAGERAKGVQSYQSVASMQGHPARGKEAFKKVCAKCHMPRRLGGERVGPDLSGINNKSKEELLESILNPSASIEPRYVNYVVVTKDGRMHDGIIV